ncbi:protein SUPPRESSOR OF NPR1-1 CONSTITUTIVE 4-like [Elaeis guineensis]|uniref:protein SUPPRESSOR OF NPR1-1 CONSTITUTIVE 4-like n=1 Tax=Elaeis guineensis var. tenera TaxID=51953 RepID=UPI003C6CFEDA
MRGRSSGWEVSFLVAFFLAVQHLGLVTAQGTNSSRWQTLSGNAPAIIAKGGFSGLFPDSSAYAFQFALAISSSDTILWCDVQLTMDKVGICVPDIKLNNCTNIASVYPSREKVYDVNGVRTPGWFSVDYTLSELTQSVASIPWCVCFAVPCWSHAQPCSGSVLASLNLHCWFLPPGIGMDEHMHTGVCSSCIMHISCRLGLTWHNWGEVWSQ